MLPISPPGAMVALCQMDAGRGYPWAHSRFRYKLSKSRVPDIREIEGAMGTQQSRTQEAAEVGNRFGGGMIRSDLLKEQN